MVWPALIAAGASLIGGVMSNRASASQADSANQLTADMMNDQFRFNAASARDAREYGTAEMREAFGLNQASADKAMAFSSQESALNRAFQQDQSSSAHQREVADLRLAGLNPILSGTGGMGAHAGPGSMAQPSDASVSSGGRVAAHGSSGSGQQARVVDAIGPAVSTALQVFKQRSEIDALEAQAQASRSQAFKTAVEGGREQINMSLDPHYRESERAVNVGLTNAQRWKTQEEADSASVKSEQDKRLGAQERDTGLLLLREQAKSAEHSARSAKIKADLDEELSDLERWIRAAEGGTSAIGNIFRRR